MELFEYINKKIGCEIYNPDMTMIRYSNKHIRENLFADDLVYNNGYEMEETARLILLRQELEKEFKGEN